MYMAFFKAGKKAPFSEKLHFRKKKNHFHFTIFFFSLPTARTGMENSWQVLKTN